METQQGLAFTEAIEELAAARGWNSVAEIEEDAILCTQSLSSLTRSLARSLAKLPWSSTDDGEIPLQVNYPNIFPFFSFFFFPFLKIVGLI